MCSLDSWFQSNMLEKFPISYLQFNSIETEIVHNMQLSKLMKQQFWMPLQGYENIYDTFGAIWASTMCQKRHKYWKCLITKRNNISWLKTLTWYLRYFWEKRTWKLLDGKQLKLRHSQKVKALWFYCFSIVLLKWSRNIVNSFIIERLSSEQNQQCKGSDVWRPKVLCRRNWKNLARIYPHFT